VLRKKAFLFSLLGLLIILCLAVPVWASAATIGITAPATVNVNQEFDVPVQVNDVTDLSGVEFKMSYNSDILEPKSITQGVPVGASVFKNIITTNPVWFADAVTNMGDVYTGSAGIVATVRFKAKAAGSSDLALTVAKIGAWHDNGTETGSQEKIYPALPSPVTVNVIGIEAPTVQTDTATSINTTSATLNGNITNTGGENCDQRKFQYRQQGAGTWIDAGATTGSYGTGTFSFALTGLTEGTGYEYKAMAHNSANWGEGSVVQFTTATSAPVAPTVQTNAATSINTTSATLNGNITDTGGENCDQRKFQYRQQGAGTWIDAGATTGSYGTGTFSFALTGLTEGTGYEYKAMAHNSTGWGIGEPAVQFTTANNNNGLDIDINLLPEQDVSFTRPLQITGTATGTGADNVAWLVEIRDGGVIASFTPANGPGFACDYTPVENLPVVGDYSVRVVATPEAGTPVEKVVPFNIYNYPLKITDLTVANNGATHTLTGIVTNLENSSQPVMGIGQVTGPDGSVVFFKPAAQITIDALGSQTIVFTFNTPQAAGTYKAEMFIWLLNDGIHTVGTPKDTTFTI